MGRGAKGDPRIEDEDGQRRAVAHEAVCFTAGIEGVPFAAGVIHAYLAADRPPPAVAAGVSAGTLSAAALAESFRDMGAAKRPTEAQRWRWYQKYLAFLTDRPLDVLWRELPSFTDLSSRRGVYPLPDLATPKALQDAERLSLHKRYLLQALLRWCAVLPVTVRTLSGMFFNKVMAQERIPGSSRGERLKAWLRFLGFSVTAGFRGLLHLVFSPAWIYERRYASDGEPGERRLSRVRPLFGWMGWLVSAFVLLALSVFAARCLVCLMDHLLRGQVRMQLEEVLRRFEAHGVPAALARWWSAHPKVRYLAGAVTAVLSWLGLFILICPAMWWCWRRLLGVAAHWRPTSGMARALMHRGHRGRDRLVRSFTSRLGLSHALLTDFQLQLALHQLFPTAPEPDSEERTRLVLVASPLQTLAKARPEPPPNAAAGHSPRGRTHQLWARTENLPVTEALRACLALPGVFRPVEVKRKDFNEHWMGAVPLDLGNLPHVELVDASVIRQNPLPALFSFLKRSGRQLGGRPLPAVLEAGSRPECPAVHVVYGVPVDRREMPRREEMPPDIIKVGGQSLRLARRRDTELEVRQTNFEARVARLVSERGAEAQRLRAGARDPDMDPTTPPFPRWGIFADDLAPGSDVGFANPLAPTRVEVLRATADGCRRTLGRLYVDVIESAGASSMSCRELLAKVAPRRVMQPGDGPLTGCPEVCRGCTGVIETVHTRPEEPLGVSHQHFDHLQRNKPRVVLVASGGVFRGAFHIGLAGALLAVRLKPDLIVGASVGTLMGAIIGTLFQLDDAASRRRLLQLTELFWDVDEKVAYTRPLLYAVRTLWLRSAGIALSPRQVSRMLRRGARADPGFASVGAPPALLDALADGLLLPHRRTAEVASLFVTGKVAAATHGLLDLLREETLSRLEIQQALLGTSLLELRARELLHVDGGQPETAHAWGFGQGSQPCMGRTSPRQAAASPFPADRRIALFGTATDLGTEGLELLGGRAPGTGAFDLVEAALASSAFPCVFSPRPEYLIRPGVGRSDVLYADGGMFDNLPFFPAYQVLREVQLSSERTRLAPSSDTELMAALRDRYEQPDLFLVGALNENPEVRDAQPRLYRYLPEIRNRAGALRENVKIRGFERSAEAVDTLVGQFLRTEEKAKSQAKPSPLSESQRELVVGLVNASVLPVFPASREHINPTFAFCRSMGLEHGRVARSIADGCYQTLNALVVGPDGETDGSTETACPSRHAAKALKGLRGAGKLLRVDWAEAGSARTLDDGLCPFFRMASVPGKQQVAAFPCPFAEKSSRSGMVVYANCARDPAHPLRTRYGTKR